MMPNTPADCLHYWASERGSGAWGIYRDAATCISGGLRERGMDHPRPWRFASQAGALGHLDIDWSSGTWSAAQPCLALSEGMGLCAFFAGWRTRPFLQRVERAMDRVDVYPFEIPQTHAPTALFAKFRTVRVLEEIAEELGIRVAYNPAQQLVDLAAPPDIGALDQSSEPPFDEPLELFEVHSLEWVAAPDRNMPGLYRFDLYGRMEFRLRTDAGWRHVDRALGQMAVLQDRSDIFVWHKPNHDYSQPPVLAVRAGISLPPVAERACVASSGLLPKERSGWRVYLNVTRGTAERLVSALGLTLGVAGDHFTTYPVDRKEPN